MTTDDTPSLDVFTQGGVTYRQRYRRCSRPPCVACRTGRGHGPYWYARNNTTGVSWYVGRALPPEVAAARAELLQRRAGIELHHAALRRQMAALAHLLAGAALTAEQRAIIATLGYAACLPPGGTP